MGLLMFLIALATLVILVWQEVRRYREKPYPQLTTAIAGWADIRGGRWELIDVTNTGTQAAVIAGTWFYEAEKFSTGKADDTGAIALSLPRVFHPGTTVRLAVRGAADPVDNLDAAWMRVIFHAQGGDDLIIQWAPLTDAGPLNDRINEQWEAMIARRRRRFTKMWSPKYWRGRKWKVAPVSPNPEGLAMARVTARRQRKDPEALTVLLSDPSGD